MCLKFISIKRQLVKYFVACFIIQVGFMSWANGQNNAILVRLDQQTRETLNNTILPKQLRDSLATVSRVLSKKLLNAKPTRDSLYWSSISTDIESLKKVNSAQIIDTALAVKTVNFVLQDFKIKSLFSLYSKPQFSGLMLFEVPVKVITRTLVGGSFKPKNGYRIFANPWLRSETKPPLVVFYNSTNPATGRKIPPGRYYFWAESPNKEFFAAPQDYIDVGVDGTTEVQIIYIDVK